MNKNLKTHYSYTFFKNGKYIEPEWFVNYKKKGKWIKRRLTKIPNVFTKSGKYTRMD